MLTTPSFHCIYESDNLNITLGYVLERQKEIIERKKSKEFLKITYEGLKAICLYFFRTMKGSDSVQIIKIFLLTSVFNIKIL